MEEASATNRGRRREKGNAQDSKLSIPLANFFLSKHLRFAVAGSKIKVSPRPERNYFSSLSSSSYLSPWANCKSLAGSTRSLKAFKCDSLFARLRFDVESGEDSPMSLRSSTISRRTNIRARKMSFPLLSSTFLAYVRISSFLLSKTRGSLSQENSF